MRARPILPNPPEEHCNGTQRDQCRIDFPICFSYLYIAGIVNPPAAKKYHYWTNDALPETAEQWFEAATQHPGSWWDDWQAWMDARNAGEKVPARVPGDGELKPLEDAPGSYAMMRLPTKLKS